MKVLRRFRVHVYLLVILSILGYACAEGNLLLLLLGLMASGASWWVVEARGGKPLARWAINLGVLISGLVLVRELLSTRGETLLPPLGHFMIIILLCKLFEGKTKRDYAQILMLSLLVMVNAAIFCSTIVFGAVLLAYLLVGLHVLLLFHLWSEAADAGSAAGAAPGGAGSWAGRSEEKAFRRGVRRATVLAATAMVTVAGVMFLALPRGRGRGMLAVWALGQGSMLSGFSDRVSFNAGGRIQQSNTVVMHVKLSRPGGHVGSEIYQPYFRGLALDTYDRFNRQWVRAGRPDPKERPFNFEGEVDVPLYEPHHFAQPPYLASALVTQHYTVMLPSGTTLFAMAPPVVLRSSDLPGGVFYPRDGVLFSRITVPPRCEYEVDSPLVYRGSLVDPPEQARPGPVAPRYLNLQAQLPREIFGEARRIAGNLWPPERGPLTANQIVQLAAHYENYLRTNYPYSLEVRQVDPGLDPTVDFLRNRKATGGHCEYFASAMAMMCAAAGIPTRMATGYRGSEYNSVGGYYIVRQRHAHAWVEIYLADRGWMVFDPTPPSNDVATGGLPAWLRWARDIYDVVERDYLSEVVAFDNTSRQRLGARWLGALQQPIGAAERWLARAGQGVYANFLGTEATWRQRGVFLLSMGAVGASVFWLGRRWYRRRTSHVRQILKNADRATRKRLLAELAFLDDLLRALRRSGEPMHPSQTPREYVLKACRGSPDCLAEAEFLVRTFYDLRFGSAVANPAMSAQIHTALARVKRGIRSVE